MTYQHKQDTGSLFKNDKKESDSHPHARGSALVGGVEYFISAWTNTKDNGEKWQNLKFSKKEENKTSRRDYSEASKPEAPQDEYDSSVPF